MLLAAGSGIEAHADDACGAEVEERISLAFLKTEAGIESRGEDLRWVALEAWVAGLPDVCERRFAQVELLYRAHERRDKARVIELASRCEQGFAEDGETLGVVRVLRALGHALPPVDVSATVRALEEAERTLDQEELVGAEAQGLGRDLLRSVLVDGESDEDLREEAGGMLARLEEDAEGSTAVRGGCGGSSTDGQIPPPELIDETLC